MTEHWFGLTPPPIAKVSWGGRAIFDCQKDRISLNVPYLCQQFAGAMEGRKALADWLNRTGFDLLRKQLKLCRITIKCRREIVVAEGEYVLRANPQGSCGYLYLIAYPDPDPDLV